MNLIDYLLNSDRMEQGSNEAIWTLIAIDAGKETPDSSHVWNRSNLLTEILEYQCEEFLLDENNKLTKIEGTVKNNLLKVQVERLGSFAVVVDSSYLTDESLNGDGQGQSNGNGSGTNSSTGNSQGGNSQGGNAQTGDDTQIMLYISLLGISMVSVLLATKKYKKVNK